MNFDRQMILLVRVLRIAERARLSSTKWEEDRRISVAAIAPSFGDIFRPSRSSHRTRRLWIPGSDIIIRPSQPGHVACNYSLLRRPSSVITIEAERETFNPWSRGVDVQFHDGHELGWAVISFEWFCLNDNECVENADSGIFMEYLENLE